MSGPINLRKQPLLSLDKTSTPYTPSPRFGQEHERKGTKKFGEVAGGTAAECAAVCCCCPCTVMNLLVLAVYKVPTGLCRKAWRRRKKKRQRIMAKKKQGGLLMGPPSADGTQMRELLEEEEEEKGKETEAKAETAEANELEKEMWDQFYGTGFWRSPSQRNNEENCVCPHNVHVHTTS